MTTDLDDDAASPLVPRRPVIGVTGPDRGGGASWEFTRLALWLAGAHAARVTPSHPRPIDGMQGLVIGGGADVDPSLYGQAEPQVFPKHRPIDEPALLYAMDLAILPLTFAARKLSGRFAFSTVRRDAARDAMEMRLIDEAVRRRLPVLGICRGEQLLNVYFGGSLYQDVSGFYCEDPETRSILPRKRVIVAEDTKLRDLLGPHPRRVNALHRQAIHRLGAGLRVAARDRNGIVQAIEHESLPFLLGVQWHPEYLPQLPEQRAIFGGLVAEARKALDAQTAERPREPLATLV
jgi:putative glutamine amidotransferase